MGKIEKNQSHKKLFENIKTLLHEARNAVVRNINTAMVMTYFEIGRMIVVDEQQGEKREGYAEETLKNLSLDLTKEFGKGFSERNLENMRKFFLLYSAKILQTMSAKSETASRISQTTFPLSWSNYLLLMGIINERAHFLLNRSHKSDYLINLS